MAHQANWLAKEILHAMKDQTLAPGSRPPHIKTRHAHIQHLLVTPYQFEAAPHEDISQTKNVFYATKAALQEAQRLGYRRIALPVLDATHVGQMLDAILNLLKDTT
jgi:O-acetyl-ADP-ribose deacetylase (regulator of RNase III)